MKQSSYDLKTILDIPHWEQIQDRIAQLTGTAIITIDFKGVPVTKHSCRTEFCSIIRENPILRKQCQRCDAIAGLEAVRNGKPYIYLCHCGIVDVAVPIMVGDKYLGAVMFGQIRLSDNSTDADKAARLVSEIDLFSAQSGMLQKDMLDMYEKLPKLEYKSIVETADLIDTIVKYIVDRTVKSQTAIQTYQWLLKKDAGKTGIDDEMEKTYRPGASPVFQIRQAAADEVKPNSPIYPAIAYIETHPKEIVSMKEMAELCHLSSSYFCRLFTRETGENFVNYINRQKVELAKRLLVETNLSVSQITGEIGYLNTSHFIEVFKRMEGVTPSAYRKYMFNK